MRTIRLHLILGATIGICYLFVALLSAQYWGWKPEELRITTHHLANSTSLPASCDANFEAKTLLPENEFFIYQLNAPVSISVKIDHPLKDQNTVIYLGPVVDRLHLLICSDDALPLFSKIIGNKFPQSERGIQGAQLAFELTPDLAARDMILTAEQDAAVTLPVHAMPVSEFVADSEQRLKVQLTLYGAISIIILYNFSLSFLLRNWIFLFNALTSGSMLLLDMTISGFGSLYLWAENPWVYDVGLLVGVAGPTLFAPAFLYYFLSKDEEVSFWRYRFLSGWTIASIIVLSGAFTVLPQWVGTGLLVMMWIVMSIVFFVFLMRTAFKGSERASIILVPQLAAVFPPMFIGATREYFGWDFGTLGNHHTEIALVAEALMFTMAVAYLIRLSQRGEIEALAQVSAISNQTARRLVEVVDEERTRISRDLHDTAGQAFVLIANRLSRLSRDRKLPSSTRVDIAETEKLIGDILGEIRQTTHDMHPPALDHLGLKRALENLIESLRQTPGLELELELEFQAYESQFSKQQSLQVFRIVQELISNVVKHANASKVSVDIAADGDNCVFSVHDNGAWNYAEEPSNMSKGIGLEVMAQRVEILKGMMTLNRNSAGDSNDIGTRFEISFPFYNSPKE